MLLAKVKPSFSMTSRSLARLGFHFSIAAISQGMYKRLRETHWAAERGTLLRRQKIAKRKSQREGAENSAAPGEPGGRTDRGRLGGGEEKVCLRRSKDRQTDRQKERKIQTNPTLTAQLRNLALPEVRLRLKEHEKLKEILPSLQSHRCLEMKAELPVFNGL